MVAPGVVCVWAWSLAGAAENEALAEALLSSEELERANRFHFPRDRRRYVAAHAGLRLILSRAVNVSARELRFVDEAFGKPRLADPASAVGFNLTHSGEYALLAVTSGAEVGVDLEQLRECRQLESIAERHFTPGEAAAVHAVDGEQRERRFFDLWTAKEAVIKLLGSGLRFPLTAFETPAATGVTGPITLPSDNPLGLESCWLERLEVGSGYSAEVALGEQPASVETKAFDLANALRQPG